MLSGIRGFCVFIHIFAMLAAAAAVRYVAPFTKRCTRSFTSLIHERELKSVYRTESVRRYSVAINFGKLLRELLRAFCSNIM